MVETQEENPARLKQVARERILYVGYLQKHPLALDLCYLLNKSQHLTATEAAGQLGVSIQTTTNALRDMESFGILESEKAGRTRTYRPRDNDAFQSTLHNLDFLKKAMRKGRFNERILPLRTLLKNLGDELSHKKGIKSLQSDTTVNTPLLPVKVDFQLGYDKEVYAVIVSRIVDDRSLLASIGKLFLLLTNRDIGDIRTNDGPEPKPIVFDMVVLLNLNDREYEGGLESWNTEQTVKVLGKNRISIIEEHPDDLTLMAPGFARKLAASIWDAVGV